MLRRGAAGGWFWEGVLERDAGRGTLGYGTSL